MNRNNRVILFSAGILVGLIASALWVYTFYGLPERASLTAAPALSSAQTEERNTAATDTQKITTTAHTEKKEDFLPPVVVEEPYSVDEKGSLSLLPDPNEVTVSDESHPENKSVASEAYEDGQVVRKEVLLGVSSLKVIRKTVTKEPGKIDSLLDESNQVKRDQPVLAYQLEFWQSPLNSRGYRAGKNKLALYGIAPETPLTLYELEEGLFLKMEKDAYRIEKTSEFRPFKAVGDKLILNQLTP